MSKSLEYCKLVASDTSRSNFSDRDWSKTIEVEETENFFDEYLNEERKLKINGTDNDGNKVNLNVELSFDANADFDYFISESSVHDGTLVFELNAMEKCVQKVCCGVTYNKKLLAPQNRDSIKFTVGNFVVLNEFGNQFSTDDKPWLQQRTTVLLPLKYENLRGSRNED